MLLAIFSVDISERIAARRRYLVSRADPPGSSLLAPEAADADDNR